MSKHKYLIVLADGTTYGDLDGASIVRVPASATVDEVENMFDLSGAMPTGLETVKIFGPTPESEMADDDHNLTTWERGY